MAKSQFSYNFAGEGQGETSSPRRDVRGYPFDLDGSERFMRPAHGFAIYPDVATYPNGAGIGCVSGFMRQMDAAVYSQMIARLPWGPTVNAIPADPMRYIIQAEFPTLQQQGSDGSVSR